MGYRPSCTGFGSIFDEEGKQSRLKEIEALLHAQEFWSDPSRAQKILKEQRALKEVVEQLEAPGRELEDLSVLLQLLREEEDQQVLVEMESSLQKLEQKLAELELTTVLAGEYDRGNAILSINPGAGGTESQ
ncbi:MAG: prfB, partial [candidate division NC10 bacterium]|nr:prfB [candidate division NC10 bacterium]